MSELHGFSDGDECVVTFVMVEGGSGMAQPQVAVRVRRATVFSAEHDLVKDSDGSVGRVWSVDAVHHTKAEAHAWVASKLRAVAVAALTEAATQDSEAARLGVGRAVPS